MSEYTRKDTEALKRDAAQRSQQMYKNMSMQTRQSNNNINNNSNNKPVYTFLPFREELSPAVSYKNENMNFSGEKEKSGAFPFSLSNGFKISELFNNIDSDKMMILALLVMLYKDGGDNKRLMMALAYLLT